LIHVGVNKYIKDNEELEIPTLEIGEETEKIQKERIDNIRNKRDNNLVKKSLNAIRNACANNDNIMENTDKVDIFTTLDKIVDVIYNITKNVIMKIYPKIYIF
jgi:methylmalonyl-CoA mutase N-terminal domain/subunit